MEMYEARALMKHQNYKVMEKWEMARLIAYVTAQTQSTKTLKMTDIVTFPWDSDTGITSSIMTDADYDRLQAKAEAMIANNLI